MRRINEGFQTSVSPSFVYQIIWPNTFGFQKEIKRLLSQEIHGAFNNYWMQSFSVPMTYRNLRQLYNRSVNILRWEEVNLFWQINTSCRVNRQYLLLKCLILYIGNFTQPSFYDWQSHNVLLTEYEEYRYISILRDLLCDCFDLVRNVFLGKLR